MGCSPFARRYLGNHYCFLVLGVLRCFSSPRMLPDKSEYPGRNQDGLPHSEIRGSWLLCSSPQLIAALRVLHRLCMPRHPPCALVLLEVYGLQCKPKLARVWSEAASSPGNPRRSRVRSVRDTRLHSIVSSKGHKTLLLLILLSSSMSKNSPAATRAPALITFVWLDLPSSNTKKKWSYRDSNPGPLPCKGSALAS